VKIFVLDETAIKKGLRLILKKEISEAVKVKTLLL
jgi:hypothetical protein